MGGGYLSTFSSAAHAPDAASSGRQGALFLRFHVSRDTTPRLPLMSTTTYLCATCGERFTASRPANTCSAACRNRLHRARSRERRAALARDAETALSRGDVAGLEVIARRTINLLSDF